MKTLLNKSNIICTIISHTPYCLDNNNEIVGLGPTVEEIDYLGKIFKKIYHCAPLYNIDSPKSYLKHKNKNIHLIPLKPMGGQKFKHKLNHILFFPFNKPRSARCNSQTLIS